MLHRFRALLAPGLLLYLGACIILISYLSLKIPPLLNEARQGLQAGETNTQSFLDYSAGVALSSGNYRDLVSHAGDLTRDSQFEGIIVTDSRQRVIASAWQGQELTSADALERMNQGGWQHWPIQGANEARGSIFVKYGTARAERFISEFQYFGLILLIGLLVLVFIRLFGVRTNMEKTAGVFTDATARISKGDFDVRINMTGRGLIEDMAGSFNEMAQNLDDYTKKISLNEERYKLAAEASNEGIWDWDIASNRLYLAPRLAKMWNYRQRDLPRMFTAWQRLLHPEDEPQVMAALEKHIKEGDPFHCEFRIKSGSGAWLRMLGRGKALRKAGGAVTRMAGLFSDITQEKAIELALEREKEQLQVTLQSIVDAVIATDIKGQVVYMNAAAERLTGWAESDAHLRPVKAILEFLNEFGTSTIENLLKAGLKKQGAGADLGQTELLSLSGEKHVVEHNVAPLRNRMNEIIGAVIVVHDVTDRYKLMQQLSHQAIHDPLTQLTNRTGFEQKLNNALKPEIGATVAEHVIFYMDLDQFKIVNDTCGHSAGDELLRQIAVQLKTHVRQGDTLARLGGDEFGLLLESCPLTKALEIAEKIRLGVESFRFSWEQKSFSIGVSIGVAPFSADPGSSVATVLSSVDQACYIAKSKGRNRIHTYQPGDHESSRWHNEMQWVPHIHRALDDGQFILYAQPIEPIEGDNGAGKHFEILLRMKSATGELIAPGSFLPAAERYDLMGTLDRWVVEHAIEILALAIGRNPELSMSTFGINISGAVLSDNSLLAYVKETLDAYKLPPSLLCFEITETVAIANFTHANSFVNELKEIGCSFALDDFGSGFASFSYLKTLPVDYLKIDGSFVRHLNKNQIDHTMVDIINQLGHAMGLKTIAEFVETEAILEELKSLGVDYAQGYHLGKPIPLQDVCYGEGTEQSLQLGSL